MTGALTLHLPDRELRLEGLPERTLAALTAVWGACMGPNTNARQRVEWHVTATNHGYDLVRPDFETEHTDAEDRVAPLVEAALYRSLPRWHASETLIHAATIVRNQRPVLLLGDSGTGKSSIALEGVRAGWQYVTDELTITDGNTVRGITRTIQFDPVPVGSMLPERLRDLDVSSYRVRFDDGVERVQPLYPWHKLDVAAQPVTVAGAVVVVLAGAGQRTSLEPIAPVEALAELHAQTRGTRTGPFGRLLGSRRAFRLRWREPREGFGEMAQALEALAR